MSGGQGSRVAVTDTDRTFEEACVDAKLALYANGIDLEAAHLLAYYPRANRNPYQEMLYSAGFDAGFACFSIEHQSEATAPPVNAAMCVHYHWVHRAFKDAHTTRDAASATRAFLAEVDRQKDEGLQILWTVHNLIGHGARFMDEEIELRAGLGERADHIHIMNPATVELCGRYYELNPSKVFAVPHPSYYGVYGNFISAEQARFDLGITPEEKTVLLFGSLGPHKGTRQFLEELEKIESELGQRLRVLIAGVPGQADYMEDVYKLAAQKPWVTLIEQHIDDYAVQRLFRASDAVVCPYDVGLNSGVAATAATFGRPCVVPDILVPAMFGAEAGVIGFSPASRASLVTATAKALEASENPETEAALAAWSETNQPRAISRAFFQALKERG